MTSKSPSLMMQVSYLCGLFPTLAILTFKGRGGSVSSPPPFSVGSQGYLLQGLTMTPSPWQSLPLGSVPGMHTLCRVWVPPPQARVQVLQSYRFSQWESTWRGASAISVVMGSPSGPVYLKSWGLSMMSISWPSVMVPSIFLGGASKTV